MQVFKQILVDSFPHIVKELLKELQRFQNIVQVKHFLKFFAKCSYQSLKIKF